MNIAFVVANSLAGIGGAEQWFKEIASRLAARGYKIMIIATNYSLHSPHDPIKIKYNNIRYMEIKYVIKLPYGAPFPSIEKLKQLISSSLSDADIIYLHYYFPLNYVFEMVYRIFKRVLGLSRVVASIHYIPFNTIISRLHEPFYINGLKFFRWLHVPNVILKYWLEKVLSERRKHNVIYVPNGVDTHLFKPIREKWRYTNKFNVTYCGRLSLEKGIDRLIRLIEYINMSTKLSKMLNFIVAGDGKLRPVLRKLANKYPNVIFLGRVQHSHLPYLFDESHLLLLPSRVELAPLTLLEAQAMGIPVIAENIIWLREYVFPGLNGYLIHFDSVRDVAKLIEHYLYLWLYSTRTYSRLREHIRSMIARRYSWDRIIRLFEDKLIKDIANVNM